MTIKEMRLKMGLTQKQCAEKLEMPYRTYVRYEEAVTNTQSFKYKQLVRLMEELSRVDETHGILTIDEIKRQSANVFSRFGVEYAYLFGSYAKGKATETSDVDILVATNLTGLKFYEFVEVLRQTLGKKIDLLNLAQLKNNIDLTNEILKDGIRIYG